MSDIWGDIVGVLGSTVTGAAGGSAGGLAGTIVGGVVGLGTGIYGAITNEDAQNKAKGIRPSLPTPYDSYVLSNYNDLQNKMKKIESGTDITTQYAIGAAQKGFQQAQEGLLKVASTPTEAAQNIAMAQTGLGENINKIYASNERRVEGMQGLISSLGMNMSQRSFQAEQAKMGYDLYSKYQQLQEAAGQKEANLKNSPKMVDTISGVAGALLKKQPTVKPTADNYGMSDYDLRDNMGRPEVQQSTLPNINNYNMADYSIANRQYATGELVNNNAGINF